MRALGFILLAGSAFFAACTLITDVDREKIPEPPDPTFPEMDAGDEDAGGGDEEPPDADTSAPDTGAPDADQPADGGSDAAADSGDGG